MEKGWPRGDCSGAGACRRLGARQTPGGYHAGPTVLGRGACLSAEDDTRSLEPSGALAAADHVGLGRGGVGHGGDEAPTVGKLAVFKELFHLKSPFASYWSWRRPGRRVDWAIKLSSDCRSVELTLHGRVV